MKRVLFLVSLLLIGVPPALADAPQTGVVTGTVTAPDGSALPGATVRLDGEQGTLTTTSGDEGKFRFVFLVPGEYTVQADLTGFQSAAGQISVSAGGRADVELKLGEAMGDEILVTGEAPMVDKYDMTSGGTLDTKELLSITGQGQQYRSRLLFLPGVFNDAVSDEYGGNRPVIAGVPGMRQMYFVDGVDVSFSRWGGGSQLNLPETAVAEIKLEATGADAQFSRAIGAYTQTTVRSGTNDFHGSAWYQMQNLQWNADNKHIDDSARADKIENGIDVSFGGPIVRDKLWFFLAYRDYTTPGYFLMANGVDVVDEYVSGGAELAKLDWRPNSSHSLSGMYVLTPSDFPWWNRPTYGDLSTVTKFDYPGDITTLTWNWAISDSLLLTVKGASTTAKQNRDYYYQKPVDPSCDGVTPCGNNWLYRPLAANAAYPDTTYGTLFLNGVGLPLGIGYTNFPRDQANGAIEWFLGTNDIKAGIDYQKVTWDTAGVSVPLCRGRGFGYDVEGGFLSNTSATAALRGYCTFYPTKATWQDDWGPASSGSESIALFARDKIALDRWTFNVGLRADQQKHHNDVGTTVLDNTSVAPRLAASYDLFGDSKMILQATAGRYYAQIESAWAAYFNVIPQGRTQYETYRWNPATRDYDQLIASSTGGSSLGISEVEPYYKDEYSVGAEWQFHPDWALKVNAYYWETQNYPQILYQIDEAAGQAVQLPENTSDAYTKRQAIDIQVQRRFKSGWMVAASYTYSKTTGTCDYLENGPCYAEFGEMLDFTRGDGVPWSKVNRSGRTPEDRPNVFKVRGAYNWQVAKGHTISIGGLAYYNDGQLWTPWTNLTNPSYTNAPVIVLGEPFGDRRIDSRKQLDLNLQWSFPVAGQFNGFLRGEILNVTDQQAQVGIAGMAESCAWSLELGDCTGTPTPLPTNSNFQYPRTIRLQVGFNF